MFLSGFVFAWFAWFAVHSNCGFQVQHRNFALVAPEKKGREVALAALIKCKLSWRYGLLNLKNICGFVGSILFVAGETVEFVVHGPIRFVA